MPEPREEEMLILRLPPHVADDVRRRLRNNEDISDMDLAFINTKTALGLGRHSMAYGRMADLHAMGGEFQARLLDLPCVIEALKTRNNQDYMKVGNVGQMLCVTEVQHAHAMPEPSEDAAFISPHGLTPPAFNALQRFQKEGGEITEEDRGNMKRVLDEVERVYNKSLGKDGKKEGDGEEKGGEAKEKEVKDRDETYEELELDDAEIAAMQADLQCGKDVPLDLDGKSPRKQKRNMKLTVGGPGKKHKGADGGAAAAASGSGGFVPGAAGGLPRGSPEAGFYDMSADQLSHGASSGNLAGMVSGKSPNVSPNRFVLSPPMQSAAFPGYGLDGPSPAYSPGYSSDGGGVYSDDGGAVNSDEDGAVLSEEEGDGGGGGGIGGRIPRGFDDEQPAAAAPQQEAEEEDDDLAGFMDELDEALDDNDEGAAAPADEQQVEGGPVVEGQAPDGEVMGGAVGGEVMAQDPRLAEIADRLAGLERDISAQRNPAMRNRLQTQIGQLRAEEAEISGGATSGEPVEGGAVEEELFDSYVLDLNVRIGLRLQLRG